MKQNMKYTSPLLQNEIIGRFEKAFQKTLSHAIPTTNYAIIVNGSWDVAGVACAMWKRTSDQFKFF